MICPTHPDRYAVPGACEFDRVPYKVEEDLFVAFLIGLQLRWYIRRDIIIQSDSFLSSLESHDSNHFLQSILEIKFTKTQLETIVLEP
jgi:hypothetical protein